MLDFKKMCKPYEKDAYETLIKDCSIDSVYDESTITKEHPYGLGVSKCFDFIREMALKDGFKVDMCDGHCIELEIGEGDRLIGIFAHQDVVPATGNWDHPPFEPYFNKEENRLYARGSSDDKGPGIATYYALKALKENGLIKNYRVRFVFGGDEERGSSCLEYYFKDLKKEEPTYGFTPDADFPLIFGEKGIIHYKYEGHVLSKDIEYIEAGVAHNVVIDKATVKLNNAEPFRKYLKEHEKEVDYEEIEENTFVLKGKAAHGSTPELGFNSGVQLLGILGEVYNINIFKILAYEYDDVNGDNLNVKEASKNMGLTTFNVGIINFKKGLFSMIVDFRHPEITDVDKTLKAIENISPLPVTILSKSDYLYFDPETTGFIKELYRVYVEETGDTVHKPMAIGGGTYAKEAKNTIAFGSCFPGKVDHIHEPNEKIDLDDFYSSIPIYAHAIYALGTFKDEN